MIVLIGLLCLLMYIGFGLITYGLVAIWYISRNEYIPDFDDVFDGDLEQEDKNRLILILTFWPIALVILMIRFIIKAIKAIWVALVWYGKSLWTAIKDFFQKNVNIKK